ncbi:hypothetical protein DFP72DRAFT_42634 [Ephemerocybe angulata]|uniref:Uncharacterized protein n=1 Tax=Ephemerocybe angulata TaxID=980116 RepID=A0A8H6HFZ5_9AGAR|nr:hypothetical protein DFP72DRAFT_42634 [Tulosesus angulatus]
MPSRSRESVIITPGLHEVPLQLSKSARTTPPVAGSIHPETGAKTREKAFSIPLHLEQMCRFIDHFHPDLYMTPGFEKLAKFMDVVQNYLPEEWNLELAWIMVPIGKQLWHTLGIVICGNRTEEEMQKQYDDKLIKRIQDILNVKTPPGWYFVTEEYY